MGDFIRQKRLKIFHVDERALLGFLNCHKGSEFLTLPTGPQIPEGCEIVRVWHDNYSRSLCVMLAHDSFPEVPDGADAPREDFFIELEALQRIPVADKFADPIHDPSRICLNCQWFYQSNAIRRFQIERPDKMCKGQCRRCTQFQSNGISPAEFPVLYADGYCGGFTRLEYPLPYPSSFPPPPITSIERWLIVANKEKYTVLPPIPPMTPETAAQTEKISSHFREVGRKLFRAREEAAIRAIKG